MIVFLMLIPMMVGCDGCMNWSGMNSETPNPNDASHYYKFDPLNATDNKGLDGGRL